MSEPKEDFIESLQRFQDEQLAKQTPEEIVVNLARCAAELGANEYYGPAVAAAASAIHDELLKRLEALTDPDAKIAVARAARDHFWTISGGAREKHAEVKR